MRSIFAPFLMAFAACAPIAPSPTTTSSSPTTGPKSTEVSLSQGLAGTRLEAAGKSNPAHVLILAGSGPTDRNGNNPLGVQAQSYKLLAEGLSLSGIASTRVDKRGMFGSAASSTEPNSVFIGQLAEDAHLWAEDIKTKTDAKCVWLIGHSEGGLVALTAAQNPEDLCGIILVATPGRKLGDVMREQFTSNPANAPLLTDALSSLTALEAGRDVDVTNFHPALKGIFAPAIQGFMKSILQVNPTQLAASYAGPMLIVQGTTDLQVTQADAQALVGAQKRATLVTIEGVNHVLKKSSADRGANLASYMDPTLPIAPEVVSQIADFINKNSR